uniref:WD40 repeat-containing protein SMU1 n=1 Tax=Cryptococcus bacillisporus CA1280 TaxID=1296109 RepID=A0A0D0VJG5_CRYGA|nr:WD-repeat protein [Cryptococcus bacillisporus CA1280]
MSSGGQINAAGPSRQQALITESRSLTTARQREKAPQLEDVALEEGLFEQEIDLLIGQYLESRGASKAARIWDEQVLGRGANGSTRKEQIEDVERAILDGDWGSIENLIARPGLLRLQSQKAFLYLVYRQQFLEHVENRESQKAFNLLQKRLKALEHYQPVPYDFYSLSYLTSASTVHDAPTFRDWAGMGPERDRLVGVWKELMDAERGGGVDERRYIPPDRLRTLLKQAAAWQVGRVGRKTDDIVKIPTLLQDYRPLELPSKLLHLLEGHLANVKCVDLIGSTAQYVVSGSSDCTLRVVSTEDGSLSHILSGHSSRVWSCASSPSGETIASSSGDGTIRLWSASKGDCRGILVGDGGDVYNVKWRPNREDQVVSASYDRILRSWDIETGKQLRTFSGHGQSTLAIAYDSTGNTIASGSKDKHVRLWDAVGGVCTNTMTDCLGEIASVEFDDEGKYLLVGCKDNSNRLWDLRMQRSVYRYTGHQNTSKNLVRCSFACSTSLVIGGSEDGSVYIWEREGNTNDRRSNSLVPSTTHNELLVPDRKGSGGDLTDFNTLASSPAYYPPRDVVRNPANFTRHGETTVRPAKVLMGHGEGAVFEVRWKEGKMVSAGEDGCVGVWGVETS